MSEPRPPRYLKPMNKVMMAVQKLGIPTGPAMVLTVPGRKSGQPRSTPMTPFEFRGRPLRGGRLSRRRLGGERPGRGHRHAEPGPTVAASQDRRTDRRRSAPGAAGVSARSAGRCGVREALGNGARRNGRRIRGAGGPARRFPIRAYVSRAMAMSRALNAGRRAIRDPRVLPLAAPLTPKAAVRGAAAGQADLAASRTGYPLRSARDRSWPSANARARPPSGITTPAHSPSAPADSTASRAHIQRRGQARHSALASVVGSRRPAVGVLSANAQRDVVQSCCGHRYVPLRSVAVLRPTHQYAIALTVAMQQLICVDFMRLRASGVADARVSAASLRR